MNQEIIEKIIEYLNKLKAQDRVSLNIIPPHIEEFCSMMDGTILGKMEMDIHIEWEDFFSKKSKFDDEWKKIMNNK